MAEIQEFKCPCCGGSVEFNSDIQKMQCPYCDSEFDAEALKSYDDDMHNEQPDCMNWTSKAGSEWADGEENGFNIYVCKSCGGEIIGDDTLGATKCPYCDNPVVFSRQFKGSLKPDYVIPFKTSKEDAKKAYLNHIKGKKLLPKVFKDENHIDEIKGIYVPFWLFDADTDADIRYKATTVSSWSTSDYVYTKTNYYAVHRSGSIGFERVPVDGSSKMADDLMESIEPYDFMDAVDFNTAYLSGYLADKYDVDEDNSISRANQRIKNSTERAFAETVVGYASVLPEFSSVRFNNGSAKYALYPVWLLNTTWNGQKFVFAMNGQTGKFVGNLPVDKGAYVKWLLGIAGIASAATFALSYLLWLIM